MSSNASSCVCSVSYFTHSNKHVDCKTCSELGENAALCTIRQNGQLFAPVAKRGWYGLRMLLRQSDGTHLARYTFHKCKPGRCLDVRDNLQEATDENSFVHSFSNLSQSGNSLSQCGPNLVGFLCHKCKPGSFRLLPSSDTCDACFLQDAKWLGRIISVAILLFLLFGFYPLVRRLNVAIPSLYCIIPFLQIFALMEARLGFSWPAMASILSVPASVFQLNINLSFYQCFDTVRDFETKWALLVSVPWCLAALTLVKWGLGIALHRAGGKCSQWSWISQSNKTAIRDQYVAETIYAFIATMIPCAAKAISIFSCRPLFKDVSAGSEYLASNPSIVCWEGAHIRLCGVAALFVLFDLICLPASVGFVLLRTGANGVRQTAGYRAKFGFLYMRFEGNFFWCLYDYLYTW